MFNVLVFKIYIVPVILCGCEICFLTSREEQIESFCEQGGEENI
jgi:hypothetical protein